MDIYLNGEKINFELEGEENAYQIINCINDYVLKSEPQQFITFLLINDQEYSYTDIKNLTKIKINDINYIYVETKGIWGVTILSINQIEKYLELIKSVIISDSWDPNFIKICDSISWMKDGVEQVVSIFDSEKNYLNNDKILFINEYEKLEKIVNNLSKENFPLDKNSKNQTIIIIDNMQKYLTNIKEWLNSAYKLMDSEAIFDNLNKLINDMDDIIIKLSNVPLLFQTGEDKEAMDIIQKLATILEKSINLFMVFKENFKIYLDKWSVKEVSFEEFFKILTDHLKKLMSAIENNDSIMIGDLLEYEFIPNIEEIKNILVRIKKEAFTKAN